MNQENSHKINKNLSLLLRWYRLKRVNEFAAQYDEDRAWNVIQQRIHQRKRNRVFTIYAGMAASVLLILGAGYFYSTYDDQSLFAHQGEQKAVLLVDRNKSYQLLSKNESILTENGTPIAQTTKNVLRYDTDHQAEGTDKHTLNIPRGGEYRLVLSDGTRIHANAESSLTYPPTFGNGKREVYLDGEAFFEVAKDSLHPFIVTTPYGSIEVTGTRFNVNTYRENRTTVTLEEGSVRVFHEDAGEEEPKLLQPGEQAIIQDKAILTHPVQIQEYISWTNGIYEYSNTPLDVIVEQLSRWYDVDMKFINPKLRERKFAGVIFRDQPLQKAVDVLSKISNVRFEQKGNIIEITEK
ncbi:MAG: FecR domain-containing protein [Bacteroides sp.]|nr:FecR domain-containing protein [Bacteroides sp.]